MFSEQKKSESYKKKRKNHTRADVSDYDPSQENLL